jgi:putative glutamine amidotransferase
LIDQEHAVKPIIGITCASIRDRDWCPPFAGHRQTYVDAVVAAGGAPFLIPLIADTEALRALYERLDGILLAGGGDIEPQLYGEEATPLVGMVDPLRDAVEVPLARWAAAEGKPLLGICRGVQLINVALGGSLYQDIPTQIKTDLVHDQSYREQDWTFMAHELRLEPTSRLARMLGVTAFPINSLHHQSIKTVAPGLQPVGWAPDGVIEALEGTNGHFVVGVQCHPEALQAAADQRWQMMFRQFIESCAVAAY